MQSRHHIFSSKDPVVGVILKPSEHNGTYDGIFFVLIIQKSHPPGFVFQSDFSKCFSTQHLQYVRLHFFRAHLVQGGDASGCECCSQQVCFVIGKLASIIESRISERRGFFQSLPVCSLKSELRTITPRRTRLPGATSPGGARQTEAWSRYKRHMTHQLLDHDSSRSAAVSLIVWSRRCLTGVVTQPV